MKKITILLTLVILVIFTAVIIGSACNLNSGECKKIGDKKCIQEGASCYQAVCALDYEWVTNAQPSHSCNPPESSCAEDLEGNCDGCSSPNACGPGSAIGDSCDNGDPCNKAKCVRNGEGEAECQRQEATCISACCVNADGTHTCVNSVIECDGCGPGEKECIDYHDGSSECCEEDEKCVVFESGERGCAPDDGCPICYHKPSGSETCIKLPDHPGITCTSGNNICKYEQCNAQGQCAVSGDYEDGRSCWVEINGQDYGGSCQNGQCAFDTPTPEPT